MHRCLASCVVLQHLHLNFGGLLMAISLFIDSYVGNTCHAFEVMGGSANRQSYK